MSDNLPLLRPQPQRGFQLTPASTEPSTPPTPSNEPNDTSSRELKLNGASVNPSRTRSILNLTSSTLFGIYEGGRDELNTPWGTGALTPVGPQSLMKGSDDKKFPVMGSFPQTQSYREAYPHHTKPSEVVVPVMFRTILLFAFGVAYGIVVTHLHDDHRLAPVKIGGIDRHSWHYLIFWGIAGVALGTLLPWVDAFWGDVMGKIVGKGKQNTSNVQEAKSDEIRDSEEEKRRLKPRSGIDADWNPVVRSIGAFIGIAFAIVRLPSIDFWHQITDIGTAEVAMAINLTSLIDSGTRQPSTMVSRRPLQSGLFTLHCGWYCWNSCSIGCQPRYRSFTSYCDASSRHSYELYQWHVTARAHQSREHCRLDMDSQCTIL